MEEVPKWILENLCYYDKRNPDFDVEMERWNNSKKDCFCDNCFYGRDKLAKEIIKLYETRN